MYLVMSGGLLVPIVHSGVSGMSLTVEIDSDISWKFTQEIVVSSEFLIDMKLQDWASYQIRTQIGSEWSQPAERTTKHAHWCTFKNFWTSEKQICCETEWKASRSMHIWRLSQQRHSPRPPLGRAFKGILDGNVSKSSNSNSSYRS